MSNNKCKCVTNQSQNESLNKHNKSDTGTSISNPFSFSSILYVSVLQFSTAWTCDIKWKILITNITWIQLCAIFYCCLSFFENKNERMLVWTTLFFVTGLEIKIAIFYFFANFVCVYLDRPNVVLNSIFCSMIIILFYFCFCRMYYDFMKFNLLKNVVSFKQITNYKNFW